MHQARHDADSYQRVEVITGRRRRRDWSDEEKARILAESADPEVNISEVARRNGVSRGLLNVWRRKARLAPSDGPLFVQLRLEDGAEAQWDATDPSRAGVDALPVLHGSDASDRRGDQRGARSGSRVAARAAHDPPQIRLPRLRRRGSSRAAWRRLR